MRCFCFCILYLDLPEPNLLSPILFLSPFHFFRPLSIYIYITSSDIITSILVYIHYNLVLTFCGALPSWYNFLATVQACCACTHTHNRTYIHTYIQTLGRNGQKPRPRPPRSRMYYVTVKLERSAVTVRDALATVVRAC